MKLFAAKEKQGDSEKKKYDIAGPRKVFFLVFPTNVEAFSFLSFRGFSFGLGPDNPGLDKLHNLLMAEKERKKERSQFIRDLGSDLDFIWMK